MMLAWNEPANNGGADIRGYFVDYRTVKGDVVGKWHEMNHQALTTTSYKVSSSSSTSILNSQGHCFTFMNGDVTTRQCVIWLRWFECVSLSVLISL